MSYLNDIGVDMLPIAYFKAKPMSNHLRKICIVESEYLIAMDIERALVDNLDVIAQIVQPKDALAYLKENQVSLAILDADITKVSIEDLLCAITTSSTPYILTSVTDKVATEITFEAKAVIEKPFLDDKLVRLCAAIMR